ncbi:hypothetical protein [Yinghuangia seranimata]|uniref:hypothetical protein n=1 Tax=Yinghuangia seranimata TaxID=408067 RepID=UPI00248C8A1F|nr:hypothetical protein [Yinghuangia seranimata]MDI2125738.1 hypothetical protein [Yinghuangia seranimata]
MTTELDRTLHALRDLTAAAARPEPASALRVRGARLRRRRHATRIAAAAVTLGLLGTAAWAWPDGAPAQRTRPPVGAPAVLTGDDLPPLRDGITWTPRQPQSGKAGDSVSALAVTCLGELIGPSALRNPLVGPDVPYMSTGFDTSNRTARGRFGGSMVELVLHMSDDAAAEALVADLAARMGDCTTREPTFHGTLDDRHPELPWWSWSYPRDPRIVPSFDTQGFQGFARSGRTVVVLEYEGTVQPPPAFTVEHLRTALARAVAGG